MKIVNKTLLVFSLQAFSLLAMLVNQAWAAKTDVGMSVTAISKNVYSIISPSYGRPSPGNKGWNSNSYFMVTEQGVLVFDTGSSELIGNEILKTIKTVTDQPVRWVVNSHSHADHWLGNAAFAKAGAEIIASKHSKAAMEADGQGVVDAFYRMTQGATGATDIHYPTAFLTHREKRNFAGVDVEFIFSNDGHSPGDVLMWLPKQKIIFGGDVLSSDWLPIMTPRGKVTNLIETLNLVIELQPEIVLPGHGNVTTIASVKRDKQFLEAVWQQVKASDNRAKLMADLSDNNNKLRKAYQSQYKDFDASIEYLITMMNNKKNK